MKEKEFDNDIIFARFIKYIQKALLHKRIDYIRKQIRVRNKEKTLTDNEWFEIPDKEITDLLNIENEEIKANLNSLLQNLSYKQMTVIKLYYIENKPIKYIAKQMNTNSNSIKLIKGRAIKKLKDLMEDCDYEKKFL